MRRVQREEAAPDAVTTRIGQTAMLLHAGDREEARRRFADLWAEIGEAGDPFHRCALAHYMADTQDDPLAELEWDLRALAAAELLGAERRPRHHGPSAVRGFYPSLHLSLAADYLKLDRPDRARDHLRKARAVIGALADDVYGDGVRGAISRMELRLMDQSP